MIPIKRFINLFKKLNNLSLFAKFTLIYVLCVMIPIIITNAIMLSRVSYYVMMRENESATYSISLMAGNIKDMVISIIIDANNMAADDCINYAATHKFSDNIEYYAYFDANLRSVFSEYSLHNDSINEINVYTNNDTITQGGSIFYLSDEIKQTDWYKSASALDYSVSMYAEIDTSYNLVHRENRYISIIRRMDFDHNSDYEAYIKIRISLKNIASMIDVSDTFIGLYLYDEKGHSLFDLLGENTSMDAYSVESAADIRDDYKKYETVIGSENYLSKWSLVGYYNTERLADVKRDEYVISIVINSIIALIALIMVYIVFYSFKYRMKKVENSIYDMAHEKFEPVDEEDSKDEIGRLIAAYNHMSVKINSLINDVYKLTMEKKEMELEKTRAELKYLQSQIDPHFLFNVLNSLLVASVKNNYTKITPQISNLAKLLRRLLYWSEDCEPISEEIEFIERYLQIEKFRFEDIFDYTINVDNQLLDFKIPKMAIQNVVENACKHGLQGKAGKRQLDVRVFEQDGRCCVTVEDNGVGMSEETLRQIMDNIKSPETDFKECIGLKNVYLRLKLHFGEDVRFDILSQEDKGTRIEISFRTEK